MNVATRTIRILCLLLAASVGSAGTVAVASDPTARPSIAGATTAVGAVTRVIPNAGAQCRPYTACPITPRLLQRVQYILAISAQTYPLNPLCRCQSGRVATTYQVVSNNGARAVVNTIAPAGYTGRLTFVVLRLGGGWLVDDTYCTGLPYTDIYRQIRPTPCR